METAINSSNSPLRIAASSYLNTAPLIWSFLHGTRRNLVDITEGVPARCAQMLAADTVEAALVPVIEFQRLENVFLVPRVCVGSKGEVRSVVLVSRFPTLEQVRSVALDESSRTSAALVRIIFREFMGRDPKWTTQSPGLDAMLEVSDAALVIGDPAMTFSRSGLHIWDMAKLWRQHTGLGFVFAMWMVRQDAAERARRIDFAAARDEALTLIDAIVAYYRSRIPLSDEELRRYLTDNIAFEIDDSMQQGLQLYFQLAAKHGLINELKPLSFL